MTERGTPGPSRPADPTGLFQAERSHLLGVAYRLLGTVTDAEDVIQDVFERWLRADRSTIDNPAAYLTTMTTRAGIDRLRSARTNREVYVGPWLPEPLPTSDDAGSPASVAELDESLTIGYLHLLEQLTPHERAAHLLHDVYDFSYREISSMIDREEANCRQLASRARAKLRASRPDRERVLDPDLDADLCRRLIGAVAGGDVDGVMSLLAEDVVHVSDGGADHRAARQPVIGASRVARLLVNLTRRLGDRHLGDRHLGEDDRAAVRVHEVQVNLQRAVLVTVDDRAEVLFLVEGSGPDGERLIDRIYAVVNPDKLGAVLALLPPA